MKWMTGGTVAEGSAVASGGKGEEVGEGGRVRVLAAAGNWVVVGGASEGVAVLAMVTRVTAGNVRAGAEVAQAARASPIAAGQSLAARAATARLIPTSRTRGSPARRL